jgi:hypothetical protein
MTSADVMAITKWTISDSRIGALSNLTDRSPDTQAGCENTSDQNQERPMIRKTIFAVATVAAIGAAALIPTEAPPVAARAGAWVAAITGSRPLGRRFRRYRGDRTKLLAMGARPRQGVCLLKSTSTVSVLAEAPVLRRETGAV